MDYEKKQPTADCIVARLVPEWGSIISLLFKTKDPYEHYYDEHGEEVPYGAIASWTDVELPPESEDEKIKKTAIKILRGVAHRVFEHEGVSKDSVLAYIEKQKPAEWSERDKTIIESACYVLELHGHAKLAEMLKSLRPQMKQEWSEEDKDYYDAIIAKLEITQDDASLTDNQMDFLKSLPERLKLQPKQKHCDYITPHKEFFQWIYNRLIDVHHENPDVDYMRSFKERIDNLSFEETTHWKPSEEQMKTLENVIKCELSASMYTRAGILQTLQNDLKKL